MNKHLSLIITGIIVLCLPANTTYAQKELNLYTESVECMLDWMNNACKKEEIKGLLEYPSTAFSEQLLKSIKNNAPDFEVSLNNFNCRESGQEDIYLLHKAYENKYEIYKLLQAIKEANFSSELYSRVFLYFPEQMDSRDNYNIYFTATGWEYGDAMTFCYNTENHEYNICDDGTPAIIINLTLVNSLYGKNIEQQVGTLKNVISHELFHAVLSDYNNSTLHWDNSGLKNNTLYLLFNEGIAHYIADKKRLKLYYKSDNQYRKHEKNAFSILDDSLAISFNRNLEEEKRVSAIQSGLYGKYWEKYICISGMFMAYHIDSKCGEETLKECVQNGPLYFIKKYLSLARSYPDLPVPESLLF